MSEDFFDVLRHSTPAEARQRLGMSVRDLDAQVLRLTTTVDGQVDSPEREAIFAYTHARARECALAAESTSQPMNPSPELQEPPELQELLVWARRHYGLVQVEITPEFLEWARREFSKYSEEEILAGIREIETTGGLELKDFLPELEEGIAPRE